MPAHHTTLSRRDFVGAVCPLVLGGMTPPIAPAPGRPQDRPGFWGPFTPEEQEVIGGSTMAQAIPSYLGQGLGCAEICLATSLDHLGEPHDWLDAAAVFSGGFGQGDLCGFLTGGMMAIGIAAGRVHDDRRALKEYAQPRCQEYWRWWTSRGPLRCSELRQLYDGSEQFVRMGQRAAARVESLIEPTR